MQIVLQAFYGGSVDIYEMEILFCFKYELGEQP